MAGIEVDSMTHIATPDGTERMVLAAGATGAGATPAYTTLAELAAFVGAGVAATAGPVTLNDQTGTSYTPVLGDAEKYITLTNASAITFTVPPNSAVAFPVGTRLHIEQGGAGAVAVAAGSGVTVNSRGTDYQLAGQYAVAMLVKKATDTWVLTGDL